MAGSAARSSSNDPSSVDICTRPTTGNRPDLGDEVSAPQPDEYPYGPFGVKQRDRHVDSSDQAITELF